jgi:hypothetical protein
MTYAFAKPGRKRSTNRDPLDRYETPEWATEALLERVSFRGRVLEPAAGTGRIARVLRARGLPVDTADVQRGNRDFLRRTATAVNVITNPPIKGGLDEAFVRHAVERVALDKVAMLLLSRFFWSEGRRLWHEAHPCSDVVFVTSRIIFELPGGKPIKGQFFDFAWFVWDAGNLRRGLRPAGTRHHFVGRPR